MNETEWLETDDPKAMLTYLGKTISDRKLWLFGCACCRRVWPALTDDRSRAVVERREQTVDGLCSGKQFPATHAAALQAIEDSTSKILHDLDLDFEAISEPWDRRAPEVAPNFATKAAASATSPDTAGWLAAVASGHVAEVVRCLCSGDKGAAYNQERAAHCDLLRDIVGNPFRPVMVGPSWLPPSFSLLVRAAYEERRMPSGLLDVARLAVLADALEDAGCTEPTILGHLRGPGPHVRGCWPLDQLHKTG
jgi:hypothetical protein